MVDGLATTSSAIASVKPKINRSSDSPVLLLDNSNESIKDDRQTSSVSSIVDSAVYSQGNSTNSTSRFASSAASTASSLAAESSDAMALFLQHLDRLMEAAGLPTMNDSNINEDCIQKDSKFGNNVLLNSIQKHKKLQTDLNDQKLLQLFPFLSMPRVSSKFFLTKANLFKENLKLKNLLKIVKNLFINYLLICRITVAIFTRQFFL